MVDLANQRVCEVSGRQLDEMKGRPLLEVLPELGTQVFRPLLDAVYATGEPHSGVEVARGLRARQRHRNGVTLTFSTRRSGMSKARIEGIFVIATDVTEQVRSRQEIEYLREIAESANRAKDEFLAMLGHELRNPLSPILTALELMKLRSGDAGERERTVIERQVSHLTRLVETSSTCRGSARQGGTADRTHRTLDVVGKAIELTSPLIEERVHRLVIDVPARGLAVEGDPTRLAQILSNLLTNAAKYTPQGGLITVGGRAEGDDAVLVVRDTGIGIAPETLPHVFDLFVQERQRSDRARGGLGLGLAIVRSLVERHGGSVSVRSGGDGQGSEFTVRLPMANPATRQPDSRREPDSRGPVSRDDAFSSLTTTKTRRRCWRSSSQSRDTVPMSNTMGQPLSGLRPSLSRTWRFSTSAFRDGRVRACGAAESAARPRGGHADRPHRLRPGVRPFTGQTRRVRSPPGEASGPAGARHCARQRAGNSARSTAMNEGPRQVATSRLPCASRRSCPWPDRRNRPSR